MNWNDLKQTIELMSSEQRATDVTILDVTSNEFYKVFGHDIAYQAEDRLDPDHPFLLIRISPT